MKLSMFTLAALAALPIMDGSALAIDKSVGLDIPIIISPGEGGGIDPWQGLRPEGWIIAIPSDPGSSHLSALLPIEQMIIKPDGGDEGIQSARPEGGDGRHFKDRILPHIDRAAILLERGAPADDFNASHSPEARKV